jgi:hypothetical protein
VAVVGGGVEAAFVRQEANRGPQVRALVVVVVILDENARNYKRTGQIRSTNETR